MKIKYKKLLALELLLMIIIVSMFSFNQIAEVKGDSNYSNYLTSESISVKNDRALILLENSGSSNNYRNYYETGFLFPSKLRDEMYSIDLTTNPSKYYFEQVYLSDLDSDYAFKDVENLGLYETNDFVQNYSDITENNGNYNNTEFESLSIYLLPNQDIVSNYYPDPFGSHNSRVNDYVDGTTLIINQWYKGIEILGFDDNNTYNSLNYYKISLEIKYFNNVHNDNNGSVSFFIGSNNITNNKTITYVANDGTWNKINVDFYTNFTNLNDLRIQLYTMSYTTTNLLLTQIHVNCLYYSDNIVLKENDNNYYNYISNGTGISGLYPAEYSFTEDDVGQPPDDFIIEGASHTVIAELDGHSKVLQLYDTSVPTKNAYLTVSRATGTFEYWMRVSDDSKRMYWMATDENGNGAILCTILGDLKYFNGAAWVFVCSIDNNQWYHHRLIFDSNVDKFSLYVDLILELDDVSYNSAIGNITRFQQKSYSDTNYYAYTDALDFSWSDGYFLNRNYDASAYSLNITSDLTIERLGNSFDNLESLKLEYSLKGNDTCDIDLYLKNIDSNEFDLVNTETITTNFQEFIYTYDLNYTYYTSIGLTEFIFFIQKVDTLLISIDKINLKAIFSNYTINNDGYHNIEISFNRKTSIGTNRGNISFNVQLYQNHFYYDYIENNVIENDYERLNNLVNFTETNIQEVEIQAHIRYGLNTLDIEICNMYYLVLINYNWSFKLFEQLRFGNNDGNYFRAEFSYSSINFNRLNLTGIYGNYSTNCLSGLRVLRADTSQNFNRYFIIPYFDEKISLSYSLGTTTSGTASEPDYPSGTYWTYETFRLADLGNTPITVENWTVDFRQVYAEKYEAKYFYKSKSIHRRDLGDWRFKITDDYKVSFNFLRNGITDIINLILLFIQYLFFLVVASFSYIFMYLGINILVLLWNTVIYWLFVALIWILWYIYAGLYALGIWLYLTAIWFYENYLIPFFEWFWYTAVPLIIDWLIIILAHIITIVIWLITLGQADYDTIYNNVYTMLRYIADELIEAITVFAYYFDYIILFVLYYLLLVGLLYLRYIYCKARGLVNRAEQLHKAFEVFSLPIKWAMDLFRETKELVNPYS